MKRIGVLVTMLVALAAASATVSVEKAQASNPVYALKLLQEGVRVSNRIVALSAEAQGSNSMSEMCGYYVPRISAKTGRLRQIVRLLYVHAPSQLRPQINSLSRTVSRLRGMSNKMQTLCDLYG